MGLKPPRSNQSTKLVSLHHGFLKKNLLDMIRCKWDSLRVWRVQLENSTAKILTSEDSTIEKFIIFQKLQRCC